jgi:hypothetical protein
MPVCSAMPKRGKQADTVIELREGRIGGAIKAAVLRAPQISPTVVWKSNFHEEIDASNIAASAWTPSAVGCSSAIACGKRRGAGLAHELKRKQIDPATDLPGHWAQSLPQYCSDCYSTKSVPLST